VRERFIYRVPASPGKHPALCAVVQPVSASAWCGGVDGEAITEPQRGMTLEGARSAAIARLNQKLSECGAPPKDPFLVDWHAEQSPVRPWDKRKAPGLDAKLGKKEPGLGGRKRP
jgi:hypothetical protein